jgi:sarcosine oxidase, subunit gamma
MPDAMRRSVFEGVALPRNARVAAAPCVFAARYVLRGGPEVAGLAGEAFGVRPPLAPLQSSESGARAALWMSPDEWLLLDEACEPDLGARIEAALAPAPHALIDVSHRHCALDVAGADVERLLNSSVNLDLNISAFPVGMVVRTLLGKAEIVLWRREPTRFRIETTRSFGPYVAAVLDKTASDQEFC